MINRITTTAAAAAAATVAVLLASCGSDSPISVNTQGPAPSAPSNADNLPNACPVDGCRIEIVSASGTAEGELAVSFEANFTPDFERNHIHVFWDSQESGAVGSDFQQAGFEVQGKWHPTDDYPDYVTQADASVSSEFRGDATTLCATAGDTDHAVIDPTIVECLDVAEYLN
jgi:hypothetical protein